ncbi:phospholipase D-like domain-containing protein [Azospirillum argentinense]|uniref:Phospholipase D n=1 Tax=Azospirillum brasilense TaxID=192 RepID=A0A4D8QGY6_AZOBR|nr:phospholipase D-like domain-containing protein [Azospirillum argentinense]QCO07500.1 hypothetical protein D3867_37075 [Azospirillum argentinense]
MTASLAPLSYWLDVEAMTPPKESLDGRGSRWKRTSRLGRTPSVDWAFRTRPGIKVVNQVRIGLFNLEAAAKEMVLALKGTIKESPDPYQEPSKETGFLATVLVDRDGAAVHGSFQITAHAWKCAHLLGNTALGATIADFRKTESTLSAAFNAAFPHADGKPVPLAGDWIVKAHQVLVSGLGRLPAAVIDPRTAPDDATVAILLQSQSDKTGTLTPTDAGSINGFFFDDLERIITAAAKEPVGGGLAAYLGTALPEEERVDLLADDQRGAVGFSAPSMLPLGKWPSRGTDPNAPEARHSLSLMQQVAVNAAFDILSDEAGLFSVNGPPGTGKSTLLRDVIAQVVVERAAAMTAFAKPADAFQPGPQVRIGKDVYSTWAPDDRLRGASIVVASSNNKAVENITLELPDAKSVQPSHLPGLDYFTEVAQNFMPDAETRAWGLISVAFGNSQNRKRAADLLWKASQSAPAKTGSAKRAAPAAPFQTLASALKDDPGTRDGWIAAVRRFVTCRSEVLAILEVLQELQTLPATMERAVDAGRAAEPALRDATARAEQAKEAAAAAEADVTDAADRLRRAEAALDRLPKEAGWFGRLINRSGAQATDAERAAARQRCTEADQALERCSAAKKTTAHAVKAAEDNLARAKDVVAAAVHAHAIAFEALRRAEGRVAGMADLVRPERFAAMSEAERHAVSLWVSHELDVKREALFLAALEVHRQFALCSEGRVLENLGLFFQHLTGLRAVRQSGNGTARNLWDTLFLVVPVISTAFASVGGMFADDLGREQIGWLIIDEAGQAVPQAAAGAIWRARRTLVVGDPEQIEPVSTIAESVSSALMARQGVTDPRFDATMASVQTIADSVNPYGGFLTKRDRVTVKRRVWVGCPLKVHRRCTDPMFSIANRVSYGESMVLGRSSPDEGGWKGPRPEYGPGGLTSCWLDISGSSTPTTHWIEDQGLKALEIVARFAAFDRDIGTALTDAGGKPLRAQHLNRNGTPNLFIIAPYTSVAEEFRALLRKHKEEVFAGLADEAIEDWIKTSVGTVHTFQGGEAQTVVLLLGGNPARERGIAWAAEKPNLLNVAATRAKARFYIVGDKAIWTRLGPDTFGLIADTPEFPTILAEPAFVRQADKERIERISSLDGHLQVLADAFAQAQRRIVITSPYVTLDAVGFEGLNLPALVRAAGARGVRVGIYVDPTQNRKPDEYRQALQRLTDAGAIVRETPGFHNKSLVVDETEIVEGSFNWLSAQRRAGMAFQRHECSLRYRGPKAAAFTEAAVKELKERWERRAAA